MGSSLRRTTLWLVLAALAIGAAAWLALGAVAAPGAPAETGRLKIVKNLGSGWPDGAFIFTWTCTDGQTGSVTFPDEFTGANFTTSQDYPLGTVCTVEETDGVLSVSDYTVTTHIESTAGFQAINPRDVPIDNSAGQNTIQYMNELAQPEPKHIKIVKNRIGGPADATFDFTVTCFTETGPFGFRVDGVSAMSDVLPVDGRADACVVTETGASTPGGLSNWATTPGLSVEQKLDDDGVVVFEFTNTFIKPQPEAARVTVRKIGPELEFGFAIFCTDQTTEGFTLEGGASTDGTFEFDDDADTITCTVVEELLTGWTTTVTVSGADAWNSGPADTNPAARFSFGPGDDVTVTFTNVAGYLSVPPTGKPPLLG